MFPPLLLLLLPLLDLNSHSFDQNGSTTNDDNGLLLALLNKQAKWTLFVIRVHFYLSLFFFSLYWTLCHVDVWVSFLTLLFFSFSFVHVDSKQNGQCLIASLVKSSRCWRKSFEISTIIDLITCLDINDDEYVLDSSICLQKIILLSISSLQGKYRMSTYDLRGCLV